MKASLQLTPLAWLKWQWFCHRGPTEVALYGISDAQHPLLVQNLWVPPQECTAAFCDPHAEALADLEEWAVCDAQIAIQRVGRLWFHTHPGDSPTPSMTDEDTFKDTYGQRDWAVMAILARGGATYARLQTQTAVGAKVEEQIPVVVRWDLLPSVGAVVAEAIPSWESDYQAKVKEKAVKVTTFNPKDWKAETKAVATTQAGLALSHSLLEDEREAYPSGWLTADDRWEKVYDKGDEPEEGTFEHWMDFYYDDTPDSLSADERPYYYEQYLEDEDYRQLYGRKGKEPQSIEEYLNEEVACNSCAEPRPRFSLDKYDQCERCAVEFPAGI